MQEPVLFVCWSRMCVHLRRRVCIRGYGLPPRPLRRNNILEIHQRKLCVCVYMYRLQTIFLFTLSSYPTLPSHLRAVLFNEPFKSICTWSMTYRIYNQALTHAKFLWSTHHPTSFTHSSLYFYLTHSHFSISISILSQEAILFSHFSLQKGKDMAADNKPLTKRDNKQPLLLWLRNLPRT